MASEVTGSMIDLHCHLLPGVDDGAETLEQALTLARIAVDDGIRTAVLTPHVHPGRYDNIRSNLLGRLAAFQVELKKNGIPLEVRLGGEVRLCIEVLDLVQEGEVPFLGCVGGYHIMLLELPHQVVPVGTLQLVERLMGMNIRPLIAHPERNKAIMAQPERMGAFVDAGCWLQLTAGALTGQFGAAARATAFNLLEQGWVHVMATDAHNQRDRPPLLSQGRAVAASVIGEDLATQMVRERPAQIVGLA